MKLFKNILLIFLLMFITGITIAQVNRITLPTGSIAPDFSLPGIDGKSYSLQSFKDAKILVIVFICNHCPTSQAYEDRLIKLTGDYAGKGIKVVAINPNNPASLRLDELGYSDVGDSFEDMKIRAADMHFNFPYLYDGEQRSHLTNMARLPRRISLFLIRVGNYATTAVLMIWKTRPKRQNHWMSAMPLMPCWPVRTLRYL